MKTKPFNKERAIAGDPVVDTTGQRWEFVEDDGHEFYPLIFRIVGRNTRSSFASSGRFWYDWNSKFFDLSMLDTTP